MASEHINDTNQDVFHPSKLLFCWSKNSRGVGQPQRNLRKAYVANLKLLYPALHDDGRFSDWKKDIVDGSFESKIEMWWASTAPQQTYCSTRIQTIPNHTQGQLIDHPHTPGQYANSMI